MRGRLLVIPDLRSLLSWGFVVRCYNNFVGVRIPACTRRRQAHFELLIQLIVAVVCFILVVLACVTSQLILRRAACGRALLPPERLFLVRFAAFRLQTALLAGGAPRAKQAHWRCRRRRQWRTAWFMLLVSRLPTSLRVIWSVPHVWTPSWTSFLQRASHPRLALDRCCNLPPPPLPPCH